MPEVPWLTFTQFTLTTKQLTVYVWISFNAMRQNKHTTKTTWSAMQRTLTFSMFNVFLHPHVHRWPSIGEKICLWICLTLVECNCILIWAPGQTSVHSAAVKGPLHSILFIQLSLPHTTNLYSGGERLPITGQAANWTIMCHCPNFLRLYSHFRENTHIWCQ